MKNSQEKWKIVIHVFIVLNLALSCYCCPEKCLCQSNFVNCADAGLTEIPRRGIRPDATSLTLRGNKITQIRKNDFRHWRNLKQLFLNVNPIQVIEPGAFSHLQNLEILTLDGNRCECKLLTTIKEFAQESTVRVLITCSEPRNVNGRRTHTLTERDLDCTSPANNVITREVVAIPGTRVSIPCDPKNGGLVSWRRNGYSLPRRRRFSIRMMAHCRFDGSTTLMPASTSVYCETVMTTSWLKSD